MAVQAGVEVVGLNRVVRNMQRMGVSVEDLKGAFTRIGSRAESHAQSTAPRVSGALAGSVRQSRRKNSVYLYAGYNSKRLPYAAVIHWGWPRRNIEGNPWMHRTVGVLGTWSVGEMQRELDSVIRRYGF